MSVRNRIEKLEREIRYIKYLSSISDVSSLVPYTGGITDVDLGNNNLSLDALGFNTDYVITGSEPVGFTYWDSVNKTVSTVLENGVIGQHLEEAFVSGQNDTGDTLDNGTVATFAGAIGSSGNIKIAHTIASASELPFRTIGIITQDIVDGSQGKITTNGKVRGIQTNGVNYGETWVNGDVLYKSTTIAGGLTNVEPDAPIPAIIIAGVISAHATNGTLLVRPSYPTSLTSLSDVNGTALTVNGQFPIWDNDNKYFDFTDNINNYKERTLVYNIPVDGVTSTGLVWIGEQRVEASGLTASYTTDYGCNNQHAGFDCISLTGSGTVTFTGISMSEGTATPTATTESYTVDATGKYQTMKKWLEITNVEIGAGITAIEYNLGVFGYVDMQNKDFKITGMRTDMLSSGVNSQIVVHIKKIQDEGNNKISVVDVEKYGISALNDDYVDELRTGGDDRSYTTLTSDIWTDGENACLKVSDYDTYFTNDENIFESSTKGEGFIIELNGIAGGAINNVSMLNLHLTIEML